MLTAEQNELLTQVGPGTPMGGLMRRYWQPIAASAELLDKPTKQVRLLGEELVLFKDGQGRIGLIDRYCPHRRIDLSYGIPEVNGLRCPYHGWVMDHTGQCVEQPFEETVHPDGRFKDKVRVAGYLVQEAAGLVWAYLGPSPAPLLPMWEPLRWTDAVRDIAITELPCNWLQCQENSLDPVHVEWLHSYYNTYIKSPEVPPERRLRINRHKKIAFDLFEHGIIKRRVLDGFDEDDDDWALGHPILFPNILLVGSERGATLQFRVPMDDTHTFHVSLYSWHPAPGSTDALERQEVVPYRYVQLTDRDGRFVVDFTFNQDYMAWVTQGPVTERNREVLGESDIGIIMYRKLLKRQLELMQDGGDPMNVMRDAAKNESLEAPLERVKFGQIMQTVYFPAEAGWSADAGKIDAVLKTWAKSKGEPVGTGQF